MFNILIKFRNTFLLGLSKILKNVLRDEGRFVGQMKVTALNTYIWNWKSNLVVCKARGLLNAVQPPSNTLHFRYRWPCISIYSYKDIPTCCTIYLQYISSNTSTCFGRIYTQSTGGTTVCIKQRVFNILLICLSVVLVGLFQY